MIVKTALKDVRRVKITECRVMRDRRKVNEEGVARSLGYAFVTFTEHEHALLALRALNNNPEIFTPEKRPIVEFSLEDKRALQIQAQRRQRQLARNELKEKLKSTKKEQSKPKNKKELRIDRLREERRATRQLKAGFLPPLIKSKKGHGAPSTLKATAKAIVTADKDRKEFVGASSVTAGGKKVPLSKKLGPKIRKRDKSKVLDRLKESKKLNKSKKWGNEKNVRTVKSPAPSELNQIRFKKYLKTKPNSKRSTGFSNDAEFDKLVAKYAKKLRSSSNEMPEKFKWFS